MASTYSSNLKIELIGTGEQSGTWGLTTNTNLGTALEQAIVGKADVAMSSTTVTLTLSDSNAAQDARAIYLNLTGAPGGAAVLEVPAVEKPYIVKNGTDQQVTVKVSGQTGVAIPTTKTMWLYNNGTDVVDAITNLPVGTTVGGGTILTGSIDLTSGVTGTLPVANGGTGITSFGTGVATALGQNVSGSGSIALTTSPSFTTPVLGTPSSGNLSNCTVDGTDAVGFRNVPQNVQTGSYTLVLADSGKHIYRGSGTSATWTIPANSSVAYPIGTALSFINLSSTSVSIAITSDTMYFSSGGTTGTRTLAQYGSATAIKIASTTWIISGSGLT